MSRPNASIQPVVVGPSKINGLGVFAAKRFLPSEVVLSIDDAYTVDDAHPVPPGEENHCDHLEGGRVVWMQAPERHINHSCRPNVYVRTEDGVRRVVALQEIRPEDEITYDYCVNGYGDTVWRCRCGAARCRREIHSDFFHLPVAVQHEYLPLLDHWFCQERASDLEGLLRQVGLEGVTER